MSEKEPDCPLIIHTSCGKLYHPELCALAREDRMCKKKHQKSRKKKEKEE